MTPFELHEWPLAALVAVLLAVSLSVQSLPPARASFDSTAVCEKPGPMPVSIMLTLH